jgi:circadian clock protein KaiC
MTPGEFTHNVRTAVDDGVSTVVIDSLTGYLTAMAEGRYLVLQLHELLSFLGQQGTTTMIVFGQHGLLNQKENNPAIDISYLADTVLHFGYYVSDERLKKWIMVFKNRSGAHKTALHDLSMSEAGDAVGEVLLDIGSHFPLPAMN